MVPFRHEPNITEAIQGLRSRGYHVMAVELAHNSTNPAHLSLSNFPIAVVFGNELAGLPQHVLDLCDGALEIPMYGTKHSLNVAVAAGIVLYSLTERFLESP